MPASTLEPVDTALRSALVKGDATAALDIAGARAKRALLVEVDFEPAGTYQTTVLDKLKSKYVVLKSSDSPQPSKPDGGDMAADETLKLPKYELYPLEAVQLGWSKCDWSVGAGMINMGNTCYLNSTLQALFHVPALVNWLISDKDHSAECLDAGGLCIICAMRKTLQDSQQRNATTIRPLLIYNKLRLVCRNLTPGRQEDAHEFLRYLVEAMENSYLNRFKNHTEFDSKVKETTPLNQILGGYLRSAVRCLKCGHVSTTFQHFQDLLLDIRKAQTLDEALEGYFSREKLDDDSYHCQSCQKKVPATKQFSLERAPMVLCIQLKRFSVSNNKITKHIQFRQRLDLTRYARHRPSVPLIYRLVALVTHMGPTVNCGHYTAVAQAPTGVFYQFDDSMVRVISHQAVFNTNAYIMLYELESSPFAQKSISTTTTTTTVTSTSTAKAKISQLSEQTTSISNNNNNTKFSENGIGFTSDKVYGPELPPNRLEKKLNGNGATIMLSNGNGKLSDETSSSDSDSSNSSLGISSKESSSHNMNKTLTTSSSSPIKKFIEIKSFTPKLQQNRTLSNDNNCKKQQQQTIRIEQQIKRDELQTQIQTLTKLVPYEADDSSCSDESVQSVHEVVESRINTKASITTEWKITTNSTQQLKWENKKTQDGNGTVTELFKMSHSGYSAPVTSWNGTRAQLDKDIANERREDRKRALLDNSDQGRVKHQKLNNNSYKSNPGYNPIQEFQNAKNWNKNGGAGHYNKHFYNPNNRHRRNFHHKGFHKNYRFRQ